MSKKVTPYDAEIPFISKVKSKFNKDLVGKDKADFLAKEFDLFIADGCGDRGKVSAKVENDVFNWEMGGVSKMREWSERVGTDDITSSGVVYNIGIAMKSLEKKGDQDSRKQFLMLGLFRSYLLDKQACMQIACENAPKLSWMQIAGLSKKPAIDRHQKVGSAAVRSVDYSGDKVQSLVEELSSLVHLGFLDFVASLPKVPRGGSDDGSHGGKGGGSGGSKMPAPGIRPRQVAVALDIDGRESDGHGRK